MKQIIKRSQVIGFTFIAGTVVLLAGCDCPRKLEALQQENQLLTERVIELENQLVMADSAASAAPAYNQAPAETVYIVAKGDTLWSIAQKQLGKGSRYKEILAMNPGISDNTPLTIGTRLRIPSQ